MNDYKTILLAEDNQNDAELTLAAMAELNLANAIVTVKDGVEVMQFLNCSGQFAHRVKGNPAVILMDIKMPRMDGIEALRLIKNDPALKFIPVVMLTSSREEPDLKKCYELGTNAYVVKPVDFKEFMVAVKQLGVFWVLTNEVPLEKDANV